MLKQVTHISIYVHNQDEALKFFTEKLGFKVHTDAQDLESEISMRWLTICLPTQPDFEICLMKADTPETKTLVGKQAVGCGICTFSTDDCYTTYKELKARGVEFTTEPQEMPWGIFTTFKDLYGNMFCLVQPKEYNQ